MGLLSREQLLTKEELSIEKVDLGKGDFVYVRQMTGRERDQFEESLLKEVKDADGNLLRYDRTMLDFRAKVVVNTLCDEAGKNLLEPDDYTALSKSMSAKRLELIVNVAQRLNKISDADRDALIKNSEGGQSAASTSDSLKN